MHVQIITHPVRVHRWQRPASGDLQVLSGDFLPFLISVSMV
jgi:hypothetical protein